MIAELILGVYNIDNRGIPFFCLVEAGWCVLSQVLKSTVHRWKHDISPATCYRH